MTAPTVPARAAATPRALDRVLVTGSAGFLGSHLVSALRARGSVVRGVVHGTDEPAGSPRPHAPDAAIPLELRDAPQAVDVFAGYDLVIHAAAATRARAGEPPDALARANVEMTRTVVAACRAAGVPRLLHVSSTAAVGISADPHRPADESFAYNLAELDLPYANGKHLAERLALAADGDALEVVVVNPGVIFGRRGVRYSGSEVVHRPLRRQVCPCTGGGLSVVHVDDVVDGILRAAERGEAGARYVLSGDNLTFREIAETVCRVAGVRRTIVPVPDVLRDVAGRIADLRRRPGTGLALALSRRYAYQFYSSDRARARLGYAPRGFERIVADCLAATGGLT